MADHNSDGLTLEWKAAGKQTAAVTAKLNGDVLACESFNLLKPKAREDFAAGLCEGRPGLDGAAIKAELVKMAAEFAGRGDSKGDKPKPEPDRLAAMPEAVRVEARKMLEGPDLLKRIVEDAGRLGVAGEKELVATLYLVGTSRLLPRPLAAIVQGPSSSGKSYVIDTVAELFPPEAVIHATQMTPQALFHLKPGSLRNRFVVAGERSRGENDDTAEATRALREMLGSGRLVKLMPVKMGDGLETVSIEQEGPIAYVESTTLSRIFDEDANRCVMLTTDEQPEQTRRIIGRLAEGFVGAEADGEAAAIIQRHHALQRMLQQASIVVPYAGRLGEHLTVDQVEARRAFPQLVAMIQASALLHQRQRQIDGDGRLVADADDYKLARHLLAKPFGRLLGGRLSDPVLRFYERLETWFPAGETFTTREAARKETASKSAVYGWIGELWDAGLLEQAEEGKGRRPSCLHSKNCLSEIGLETWTQHVTLWHQKTFVSNPAFGSNWKQGHNGVLFPRFQLCPDSHLETKALAWQRFTACFHVSSRIREGKKVALDLGAIFGHDTRDAGPDTAPTAQARPGLGPDGRAPTGGELPPGWPADVPEPDWWPEAVGGGNPVPGRASP